MRVIRSTSTSVQANLAWEEWLLDRFEAEGPVLFFCVNEPAVVVGKNQNPWRETHPQALARDGVTLARRVSGGGTVYHDAGNLNYSLVQSRHDYRQDELFHRVIAALLGLGIPAEMMAGHGLSARGRKFSGSAFCYRGGAVLHHGTLLVDSDLPRLRRSMKGLFPDLETRAVASKPASVTNLTDVKPGLTLNAVQQALTKELSGQDRVQPAPPPDGDPAWRSLWQRNQGWDWILGYTPGFSWTEKATTATLHVQVEQGVVQRAELRRCDTTEVLAGLHGCRFIASELVEALMDEVPGERTLIGQLKDREF